MIKKKGPERAKSPSIVKPKGFKGTNKIEVKCRVRQQNA